jgi:hypothetical protein
LPRKLFPERIAAGESPAAGRRLWTIADYFIKASQQTN